MQKIASSQYTSILRATAPPFTYSGNHSFFYLSKFYKKRFNLVATEDLTHMNKYTLSTVNSDKYRHHIDSYNIYCRL